MAASRFRTPRYTVTSQPQGEPRVPGHRKMPAAHGSMTSHKTEQVQRRNGLTYGELPPPFTNRTRNSKRGLRNKPRRIQAAIRKDRRQDEERGS